MEEPQPRGPAPEPSRPRLAWDATVLRLRRSRDRLREISWQRSEDELLGLRGILVLAGAVVVLVVIGGLVYLADPFDFGGGPAESTQVTSPPAVRPTESELPRQERVSPTPGTTVPAPAVPSPNNAHALAGAELADRPGIQVSPEAAALLRSGAVDGRVLIVMSALASQNRLQTVDLPPSPGTAAPSSGSELELGVTEVDSVLQWLNSQIALRPDRLEVRSDATRSYLRLIYSTPEPAGLFPS
jgi:hypothetical protein